MKSATECLFEYSIDIMEMDDHFNCQLLAAMERYAEQRSAHLAEGFVAALRVLRTMMGVEGLTLGVKKCDELLSELNSNEPGAVSSHEAEKVVCEHDYMKISINNFQPITVCRKCGILK